MKAIKAITFDAINTIIRFRYPPVDVYIKFLQENSSFRYTKTSVSEGASAEAQFLAAFKRINTEYPCYGYKAGLTDHEWWKLVIRDTWLGVGAQESTVDRLLEQGTVYLMEHFSSSAGYSVFPETVVVLERLRQRGYVLGVISNSDSQTLNVLGNLGLSKYFDFVLDSSSTGLCKPDQAAFKAALKLLEPKLELQVGVGKGRQVLHVGDHFRRDWVGALNAGFYAAMLDREYKLDADNETVKRVLNLPNNFGIIHSLEDIEPFLE